MYIPIRRDLGQKKIWQALPRFRGALLILSVPQCITELQSDAHSPRCILGLLSHADQTQSCSQFKLEPRVCLERVRAVWLGNEDVQCYRPFFCY